MKLFLVKLLNIISNEVLSILYVLAIVIYLLNFHHLKFLEGWHFVFFCVLMSFVNFTLKPFYNIVCSFIFSVLFFRLFYVELILASFINLIFWVLNIFSNRFYKKSLYFFFGQGALGDFANGRVKISHFDLIYTAIFLFYLFSIYSKIYNTTSMSLILNSEIVYGF